MTGIRRIDKEITDLNDMKKILKATKYVTVAMCLDNEPYLATLSCGYDEEKKTCTSTVRRKTRKSKFFMRTIACGDKH